jgi:hypothetical protein
MILPESIGWCGIMGGYGGGNQDFIFETELGNGTVWFFPLAVIADGGVGQGEEARDFQILTPHPNPLPVWRGEGVRRIVRHYPEFYRIKKRVGRC